MKLPIILTPKVPKGNRDGKILLINDDNQYRNPPPIPDKNY